MIAQILCIVRCVLLHLDVAVIVAVFSLMHLCLLHMFLNCGVTQAGF